MSAYLKIPEIFSFYPALSPSMLSAEFCCYNYILYMLYKWCNIIKLKYFFDGKKVFTNGSRYEPAVMGAHHQRLAHASPPVYEPAVMNPLHHRWFWNRRWWPRYQHRLKSNGTQNRWWCTFRTGGDRGGCSSAPSSAATFRWWALPKVRW